MKKILSGLLVGSILFGGAVSIHAAEVDETGSASITVNGSLGQDNTDEQAPNIQEGSEDWINVTLDTANIFYTTKESDHKTIASPHYEIKNNSGRAVKVSVADFKVESGNLSNVEELKISGKDYTGADQAIDLNMLGTGEFLVLANNQGRLDVENDPTGGLASDTLYSYSGTTAGDYYKKKAEHTTHTLTLAFEALGKNGQPVTP